MELSLEDMKKVIKAESLKPGDLFSNADLSEDPSVKGLIDSAERRTKASFHDHNTRTEEQLDKIREEEAEKKKEVEKENKKLKREVAKSKVDKLFETAKTDRKLTEKQVKYLEKRISKFEPDDPEKLDTEFSSFLDDNIKEFKSIAEDVFGEKKEETKEKTGDGDGNGDGDGGNGNGDTKDSADENIFID